MINDLVPTQFYLGQNYPNPFSDKTVIKYCVGNKSRVQITIYDSDGNKIEKLVDEVMEPGTYQVEFDAAICHSSLPPERDDGRKLSQGYYYYKMIAGDFTSEKKWLCINKLSEGLNMKTFSQTLFFFLLVTQICFAQWYWQNPLPQGNSLSQVYFIDENIGIAVGAVGTIIRTTNGGNEWTLLNSGTTQDINRLFFINNNLGFAVGTNGTILKTSDAGTSWSLQQTVTECNLVGIHFFNDNIGWIVGGYGEIGIPGPDTSLILYTTDGGNNWTQQNCEIQTTMNDVFFHDSHNGIIVGNGSTILRTTNAGLNWIVQNSGGVQKYYDIYFVDDDIGWMVVPAPEEYDEGRIFKTIDGGTTWVTQASRGNWLCRSISFANSDVGFAVGARMDRCGGPGGLVLRTEDGGINWIDQLTWEQSNDFCFTSPNSGMIAGGGGEILKTTDLGTNWYSL